MQAGTLKIKTPESDSALRSANLLFRAVTHPLRQEILEFLDQNQGCPVNKIYNAMNIEQSVASQHLAILRKENLVYGERSGKYIYYSINYKRLEKAVKFAKKIAA